MAYVSTTWTAGTPIDAATLESALDTLRVYVNRRIRSVDFSADVVATEDILEGDPVGATRTDFHAVSGDVYAQHADSARVNRQYLTGTVTNEADYTAAYPLIQYLPGCSKQFVVEREALVVLTCWLMTIVGESSLSLNAADDAGIIFLQRTGGTVGSVSQGPIFIEDPVLASASAGPQPAGSAMNRRPYNFTYMETLPAGTYTYSIYVDLHSEKMFVSARNLTIEVLYL